MNFRAEVLNVKVGILKKNGIERKVSRIEFGAYSVDSEINLLVNEEVLLVIDELELPVQVTKFSTGIKRVDKDTSIRYHKVEVLYRGVNDSLAQLVNDEVTVKFIGIQ